MAEQQDLVADTPEAGLDRGHCDVLAALGGLAWGLHYSVVVVPSGSAGIWAP